MDTNNKQQGYIFINAQGRFAQEGLAGGFARSDKTIRWVDNVNDATVFPSERPYGGSMTKYLDVLKKAQPLQAISFREVKIQSWKPAKEKNDA